MMMAKESGAKKAKGKDAKAKKEVQAKGKDVKDKGKDVKGKGKDVKGKKDHEAKGEDRTAVHGAPNTALLVD